MRLGVTLEEPREIANQMSDNQFARRILSARFKLFRQIIRFAQQIARNLSFRLHFSIRIDWQSTCQHPKLQQA